MRFAVPWVTWRKNPRGQKLAYLTFDDGPTAEFTPLLLNALKQFDAQATFFCLGENVEKNPDQLAAILDHGHAVGNHSYSHPNGWQTRTNEYVSDVMRCQEVLANALGYAPKHFRPPFGRISMYQTVRLRSEFEIVMWDILSMDYQPESTGLQVANNVTENTKPGSIVLLHDSKLAAQHVTVALPIILQHLSENGIRMCTLDQ